MKTLDSNASVENWLKRPLCRRYAAVTFSEVRPRKRSATAAAPATIWWAFGTLTDGQSEILGAWTSGIHSDGLTPLVFGDIYRRGGEFIRFGVGDLSCAASAFEQTYRHGQLVGSIEQAYESAVAATPARHRAAAAVGLRASVDAVDFDGALTALARLQATTLGERYPAVVQLWEEVLARCKPLYGLHPELREMVRSADRKAAAVREQLTRALQRHGPFSATAAWHDFVVATLERADRQLCRDVAVNDIQGADSSSPGVLAPRQAGDALLTARA